MKVNTNATIMINRQSVEIELTRCTRESRAVSVCGSKYGDAGMRNTHLSASSSASARPTFT